MNDIAVFLDLDNLVIGAKQASLTFDINLILNRVKELTNGRIVLARSYGDWRQEKDLMHQLSAAGFNTQSTVRLNSYTKNLADMQIVVDVMETLVDGQQFSTYVLLTGDRDFTPVVQSLRKRGKQVIGVGVKHTASKSFVSLCDHYLYYEDLIPNNDLTDFEVLEILEKAIDVLLTDTTLRVRASVLKQQLSDTSNGRFEKSQYGNGSFSKFLARYPHLVELYQEGTTTYVCRPQKQAAPPMLHLLYRSELKKQRLRVIPYEARFAILRDLVATLQKQTAVWRPFIDSLGEHYQQQNKAISKNEINALLLVARQAQILTTHKSRSLGSAAITLNLKGEKPVGEAIMKCDAIYLQAILNLSTPFDLDEAALALYGDVKFAGYLKTVMEKMVNQG